MKPESLWTPKPQAASLKASAAKTAKGINLKTPINTFTVYILECADKTYYVGCTNNLEKRIGEHNGAKSGAHYTKIRRPVKLIYKEEFKTLAEGRRREAEIKRLKRSEKEKLWIL